MTDPKKVLYYVAVAVCIAAFLGAFVLFGIMYLTGKYELIYVPYILAVKGADAVIIASVIRAQIRRQQLDNMFRQQMNNYPGNDYGRPAQDPFTVDPFADAFSESGTENKSGKDKSSSDKFCIQCGAPRVPGDKFCPYCGRKYE